MRRNNKSRIIMFLCMTLVFMGIGYAAYQTRLTITGTSRVGGFFNVEIISVSEKSKSTNVTSQTMEVLSDKVTANFSAKFTEPGEYIKYNIVAKNKGTIDALLNIVLNEENNETDSQGNKLFLYELNEYDTENEEELGTVLGKNEILESNDELHMILTITFNPQAVSLPTRKTTFKMKLNSAQLFSRSSQQQLQEEANQDDSQDKSCFKSVIAGEINYYDASCGVDVSIPNGISLKTSTVTSVEFNTPLCIAFAPDLKSLNNIPSSVSNEQFCQGFSQQVLAMSTNDLFNSFYSAFAIPTFGEETGEDILVTKIGAGSFVGKQLESLSLSNNIQVIKDAAFTGNSLTTLSLPNSLTQINDLAFLSNNLSSVTFGSGLTTIGNQVFLNNQITGSLTIPASVTNIGSQAFYGNQISSLSFESGSHLQAIGNYAFRYNQIGGTLTIPPSVSTIDNSAFSNNQTLTNLTIPNVTNYGTSIFYDTQIVNLSVDLTNISTHEFSSRGIQTLTLGPHVQTVGDYAFQYNSLTGALTIPSGITSIGANAFAGSNGTTNQIASIIFENNSNLQTIGNSAFYSNRLSGTLTIPASVTSIGTNAFGGKDDGTTNQITSLVFANNSNLQTIGDSAFQHNHLSGTLTIPSSVTSIGASAFVGKDDGATNQITTIVFTSNSHLQTIGNDAFAFNALAGTLTIPASVQTIGERAFSSGDVTWQGESAGSTNQLTSVVFENNSSLQTIGGAAFQNNHLTGLLTIPSNVTSIGYSAFHGKENGTTNQLTSVTFESGSYLETIGDYAFANNALTRTLTIPSSVTSIGNYTFEKNQITGLVFASGSHLETIGIYAFSENSISGTLTIPASVITIESYAFYYGNTITSLSFESGSVLDKIGTQAFYSNQISGTLTLPDSLTDIGLHAFENNRITTLNLGSNIKRMGGEAFYQQASYPLSYINIDMTEQEWNTNVRYYNFQNQLTNSRMAWYNPSSAPIVTYKTS